MELGIGLPNSAEARAGFGSRTLLARLRLVACHDDLARRGVEPTVRNVIE